MSADGGASSTRPVEELTGEKLRWWSSLWRYAVVIFGAVMTFSVSTYLLLEVPAIESGESWRTVLPFIDLVFGAAAITLLPLRRRYPAGIAVVTGAMIAVSPAAGAGATMALISLATHGRLIPLIVVGLVWTAAGSVHNITLAPEGWVIPGALWTTPLSWLISAVATAAIGLYIGAHRALIRSLHERALVADHERELVARAAEADERTRIAREMHDVLAHRISLVAMHAGALAYRDDLTRGETRETAGVIQRNASHALTELRGILGVLRATDGSGVEPPQPTLSQLHALIDDAGPDVTLHAPALNDLPETISRTAYRVVQEALTNARKHAAGSPVVVRIDGKSGGILTIDVTNAPAPDAPRGEGTGMGLAGLAERVVLAGGTIEHGETSSGGFRVRALLPWETEGDE
ncbi:sensor histidine kinase [Microbacterium amylolyticum]|uniref:sensor histidine kinase n=1 Tax=Microbacterium amylolyticum TaxID=936337 RepID=UPI0019D2545B|nr:histidine kinase [Microbacterium amylolyticum]